MLRIKLSRVGKKKQPMYRILVMEKSKDPWGNFLENVGFYNPLTDPKTIELNKERISYWISKGAQPTDTVHNLLVDAGVVTDKKRNVSALGKKVKEAAKKAAEDAKAPKEGEPKAEAEGDASAEPEAKADDASKEEPAKKEASSEEKPAEPEAKTEDAPKEDAPKEDSPANSETTAEEKTE